MTALEFLARWVDHVPERYEARVRYGPRGGRERAGSAEPRAPPRSCF